MYISKPQPRKMKRRSAPKYRKCTVDSNAGWNHAGGWVEIQFLTGNLDDGERVKVKLTTEEAESLAAALDARIAWIHEMEGAKSDGTR